jgi:hypothetical protein
VAHVFKKAAETLPSLADANTSTSIVLPAYVRRVLASLTHSHPNAIKRMFGKAVKLVSSMRFKATAGSGLPAH